MTLQPRLRQLLEEDGRAGGIFDAAAAWVSTDRAVLAHVAAGAANQRSLFDLASLTKPMATASLSMCAVADGALTLGDPLPGTRLTLEQLLGHRAGFPAHLRFADHSTRVECERLIWDAHQPSSACTYTDLGYMVLGWHLEATLGGSLADHVGRVTRAVYLPRDRGRCIPTGYSPLRTVVPPGDVHDDNCWVLGGVAGHAGLFGTAEDVGLWAQTLLRASLGGGAGPFDGGIVRRFWDLDARLDASSWVLGFDTPTPPHSSAGRYISPDAVGHLGFTGTSVWIDRSRRLVMVLLTNRVASPREHDAIKRFRPRFHDAVLAGT